VALRKAEIIPIQCEQKDSAIWSLAALECSVVLDGIGYNNYSEGTLEAYLAVEAQRAAKGLSTRFIFTSGIMTYGLAGDQREEPLDETVEPQPSATNLHGLPRKLFEEKVMSLKGEVVRPGWVYGGTGGTYNAIFFGQVDVVTSTVTIKGRPDKRFSWVHIEDLATAFQLLIDAPEPARFAGQLFNFVAEDYPSYEEIIMSAASAAGIKQEDLKIVRQEMPADDWMNMLETRVVINNKKAREWLGWTILHSGFLREMGLYYPGWVASNKK
jgi:nucleoside-diphosphate-sugar epimerase